MDKTDNTMVKRIKGGEGGTNNGGQDRQHNGQDNKGRGGGRGQTMVDKTDNTMVKRIKGGEGGQTMVDKTDNTMVKRIMGGDKQWWTRQTTQWSRE